MFFCWIFLFRSYMTQICSAAKALIGAAEALIGAAEALIGALEIHP